MSLSFFFAVHRHCLVRAMRVFAMRKLLESDKKESTDADDVDKVEYDGWSRLTVV